MTTQKARRLLARFWSPPARRALMVLCYWLALPAAADTVVRAQYEDPTDRYGHGVLGDEIEHETLVLELASGDIRRHMLPETSVFEDTEPRLADLDGDGRPEVLVVESDQARGARLAVYNANGRLAQTPYIGTRFRWLAPLGASDLDGDGQIEIAYVDRPHLAKTLRIWRYDKTGLSHVADLPGVTNHRIGERDIAGGIRLCGAVPEMVLADAGWRVLLAVRFDRDTFTLERLGQDTSRRAFAAAMACRN